MKTITKTILYMAVWSLVNVQLKLHSQYCKYWDEC